ncbi:MAG: Rieske 2Fe-2S domain-containing protein [Planctomycetes bacterium]|nr:Rieske 2Fe-2S domain-containing protein [Planctomycetota bacterium]
MASREPIDHPGRRAACKACIGGLTVGSMAGVGFPVISFLRLPSRAAADRPVEIALDQLQSGQVEYAQQRGQQVIVLSTAEGPLVLSAACTHLGCNVLWDTADRVFRCPCHGATFGETGEVLSGPVNAPLKRIPFEIKDGTLFVT